MRQDRYVELFGEHRALLQVIRVVKRAIFGSVAMFGQADDAKNVKRHRPASPRV